MELGEMVSYYRNKASLTIDELSAKSGVPKGTINKIIAGTTKDPQLETIRSIAYALGITLDDLDGNHRKSLSLEEKKLVESYRLLDSYGKSMVELIVSHESARSAAMQSILDDQATVEIIVYDFPAAAGIPVYAEDGYERIEYPASKVPSGADFGIRIAGDSMEPTIKDGDVVFIRKTVDLRNGDIGIFMIDDESVCKRYYKEGKQIELHSDNPDFPPITIKSHQRLGIVGKVMGYK